MQLTVHTERGSYVSKAIDLTPEQAEQLQALITSSAEKGAYFEMETASGYVVLGKNLLLTAVFVVEV